MLVHVRPVKTRLGKVMSV